MWNTLRQIAQKAQNATLLGNVGKLPLNSSQVQFWLPPPLPHFTPFQKSLWTSSYGVGTIFSHSSPNTALLAGVNNYPSSLGTWLTPASPMFGGLMIIPSRGMKIKGKVKRRCKDCYLIWVEGILHNRCKTHPRHTQMLKPKYWANVRLLTHATMSPKRPW